MVSVLQGSLLDVGDEVVVPPLDGIERTALGNGAWVDVQPGWVRGSDVLFTDLADAVPWHGERRQMYERMVDVLRLLCFCEERDRLPHPALVTAKALLNAHYAEELGEPSGRQALASTATAKTAWPGTVIGSAGERTATPWSRSSQSVPPVPSR